MLRTLLLMILCSHFSLSISAQNNPPNEKEIEQKIAAIQNRLKVIKNDLNLAYGEEQRIIEQLEFHDQQINKIVNESKKSLLEIEKLQSDIDRLQAQIDNKNKKIESQKNQILELLKIQIYMNHDKALKMLLVSPQYKNKDLIKHQLKYLQNQLYSLIHEVAEEIKSLQNLVVRQTQIQDIEKIKQAELLKQQENLESQKQKRLMVLNQLKKEISSKQKESESLSKDQSRLQNLLYEIVNLLSDLPEDLGQGLLFAQLKGKILQPVAGSIIRSFKSKRSENTKWNGVVIESNMGTDVRSVAYGRVAFADWLRGFGMLVILDHQGGYMSLYGFNQSIEVDIGDWVDSGQVIATVGNSGILGSPALYFEIRKDAEPQNPTYWFQ